MDDLGKPDLPLESKDQELALDCLNRRDVRIVGLQLRVINEMIIFHD